MSNRAGIIEAATKAGLLSYYSAKTFSDEVRVTNAIGAALTHAMDDGALGNGLLTVAVKIDDTMLDEIRGQLDDGERIILDVVRERMRQDEQWGGSRHDDTHHAGEWLQYIGKQQVLAVNETIADDDLRLVDPQGYRERLVKIAALAVAALQSHDRKSA